MKIFRITSVLVVGSLVGLAALAATASCSLSLDESLLDKRTPEPFVPVDAAVEAAVVDAAVDAPNVGTPATADCAADADCLSDHGCLNGRCDFGTKRCMFDVCRPAACSVATCDAVAKTCSAPTTYKLGATQFDLGSRIACPRCAAAVRSWLFVVTNTGLVAVDMSNPASASPPQVPISGLSFVPLAIVQGGSRVWLVGTASGDGPGRLELATIDVPADPFTTKFTAQTVLANYNRKAEAITAFPGAGDSALLVGQTAPLAATFAVAPLVEATTLTASPFVVAPNFGPSALSGSRLLMSAVVNQAASFYLVENAGTTTPSNGATSNLTTAGAVSTQRVFAQGAEGSIFWATGVHQATSTRAARGYFLIDGVAGLVDGQEGVDIEVYGAGVAANAAIFGGSQGAAAVLDANTVMVATQAKEGDKQTAVQFVSHYPFGLVKDATGTAPRRQVLPVKISDVVATAGSAGIGYVIANGDTPTASSKVYVFDPACP